MQFFVGDRISQHMARLKDGSLLCQSVPLCRTGTQMYRATELASLGGILPEGYNTDDMIPVYRPREEVMSTKTMASLEGVPCTDDHPPQFINPMNYSTWQSGHVQNIREGPRTPEGEYTVVGDMIIRDGGLADKVERSLKREVSVGYTCTYDWDGKRFIQRDIIANHVACVKVARGGSSLQIMDAAPDPMMEVLSKLGRTLDRAMDYPEAWPYVRECLEIVAEMDAKR
jgi:hypothetical protein